MSGEKIVNICGLIKEVMGEFYAFEVNGCLVAHTDETGKQYIDICEDSEAEFWSVYVHYTAGGVDCICDCETKEQANQLVGLIKSLIVNYKKDGQ